MARPQKQTVDYYPHVARCGKTIFILERKWGNDGYAVFHKLLETLCTTEGHIIDYGNAAEREFLVAKTLVSEDTVTEIIEMLVSLGKFDAGLWSERKIWYQKLVDSVADVYKKRTINLPEKPVSATGNTMRTELPAPETPNNDESGNGNPQSKLKETIVSSEQKFSEFYAAYPRKKNKPQAARAWKKIKPSEYDAVFGGLINAMESKDWLKDGGDFIPYPATWLNGRGWEDEYGSSRVKTDWSGVK